MFIGVRIHHANDLESQALYGANHGYAFAAGMVSQSASCSTRVRRDGSYLMQLKSSCSTYPIKGPRDFFIFFCSLRRTSETRRVPKQFQNRLRRSTRNPLIYLGFTSIKKRQLVDFGFFSVSIY